MGQVLRIVHVNRAASDAGVCPGQTLADAKALVPQLGTCNDDPSADATQLESLAVASGSLSPVVHLEGTDTLIVDVSGCERLYRDEGNILCRAVALFEKLGFRTRCAIADTLGAAWALAHAHPDAVVLAATGQTAADLTPLPTWSLRIESRIVDRLASIGVETVGSLFLLPRSSLTSRFGATLLLRMDQALGNLPEVLRPFRPAVALTSRLSFGGPTHRLEVFVEGVRRGLTTFCERLAKRSSGVRQVFVTFHCPDVVVGRKTESRSVTIEVDLSRATRSAAHLFSLLRVRLDALALPAPADSLMIWSRAMEPLDGWQAALFETDVDDPQALGAWLDRLAVRLSPGAVVRAEPVSDHQPEKAFRYVTLVGHPKRTGSRLAPPAASAALHDAMPRGWQRPMRLLFRPVEVGATALAPEGPPAAFQLRGARHVVVDCEGPERIETGWWRGPHLQRDYYRVLTEAGRRAWVFRRRDTGQWFLHGWFD